MNPVVQAAPRTDCRACVHCGTVKEGVSIYCLHPKQGGAIFSWKNATELACGIFEQREESFSETLEALERGNPKDAIGVTKVPLSLFPSTATALASLAFLNGALKYGKYNWRQSGVKASIYLDACRRHLAKWENGEEVDEDGVPHLAAALASVAIIVDAGACGKLNDDRPPGADVSKFFDSLVPIVKKLSEKKP